MGSTFTLGPAAEATGYRVSGYQSVGSTNVEAANALEDGADGLAWFVSTEQTDGRGRRGRDWATTKGNLAASLLLRPDVEPDILGGLGFVAGVALHDALSGVIAARLDGVNALSQRVGLKWPNDVLMNGAKLSGILLEAKKDMAGGLAVIVGIGVNVVQAPEGLPYPATSLNAELGAQAPDAAELFTDLSNAWAEAFALWDCGRGMPQILARWRTAAAGLGGPIEVQSGDARISGRFEDVDENGRLVIRCADGTLEHVSAGDVYFGTAGSVQKDQD